MNWLSTFWIPLLIQLIVYFVSFIFSNRTTPTYIYASKKRTPFLLWFHKNSKYFLMPMPIYAVFSLIFVSVSKIDGMYFPIKITDYGNTIMLIYAFVVGTLSIVSSTYASDQSQKSSDHRREDD